MELSLSKEKPAGVQRGDRWPRSALGGTASIQEERELLRNLPREDRPGFGEGHEESPGDEGCSASTTAKEYIEPIRDRGNTPPSPKQYLLLCPG